MPALTDNIPLFNPCTVGVGYALLVIVPVLYVTSSALFVVLGLVIHFWYKKTAAVEISYSVLDNDKLSGDDSDKSK